MKTPAVLVVVLVILSLASSSCENCREYTVVGKENVIVMVAGIPTPKHTLVLENGARIVASTDKYESTNVGDKAVYCE